MTFFKTILASAIGVFVALAVAGILCVLGLIGIVAGLGGSEEVHVPDHSVLTLDLGQGLTENGRPNPIAEALGGQQTVTLRSALEGLRHAAADDRIDGVLLRLGGFAASWSQAEELRTALLGFRTSGKFIYAVSDEHGIDEKQYFVATAADTIVIDPAATFEVNGIAAELTFYRPLLDKLGIEPQIVRVGTYKTAVEPFLLDSASEANRQMVSAVVDDVFEQYIDTVVATRKIDREHLTSLLDSAALLTADEAQAHGLVDAVLYADQVRERLLERTGRDTTDELNDVAMSDYASSVEDGTDGHGKIAVVYAVGAIAAGESSYDPTPVFGLGETIGATTFVEALRTAREDDDVNAVVVRINSPGGDASASETMWREMELTARKKPVVVSMSGYAASGGYFIAAPANVIVAEPSTLTGSIGVYRLGFNLRPFLEEHIGIHTQAIRTNPHADMGTPLRALSDAERAILQRTVDSTYAEFLSVVARGRHLSIDSVRSIAEGRVWTGEQARELGLVDTLGGLQTAIAVAARRAHLDPHKVSLTILPRELGLFESIRRYLSVASTGDLTSTGVSAVGDALGGIDRASALSLQARKFLDQRSGLQARMVDFQLQ